MIGRSIVSRLSGIIYRYQGMTNVGWLTGPCLCRAAAIVCESVYVFCAACQACVWVDVWLCVSCARSSILPAF